MGVFGTHLPMYGWRVWKLATEGASHQPEGLWPEGWCEAPEVVNDTHAQHTWVGVTFMHEIIIN